ncbi:uncharacterized protein LOC119266812 [Triticum dicoccoides]|uniref:uncharacterized protein LOC119266812 n=1 Tax=Triticum dicoccoides TaxID=85692 RepID=UPI00188F9AE2|nr:uncharacterized protein LOC119266812 [Triticum dicoccoides]
MVNANQGADPPVLEIIPCPDCGRRVVTFVARRGQFAGERFYKCRNHNPGRGGCDFYRWQEAYLEHLVGHGPVVPLVEQLNPGDDGVEGLVEGGQMQAANVAVGQHNRGPEASHMATAATDVAGSLLQEVAVGRCQPGVTLDAASINLVVSVGNMAICVAILVLVVAAIVMRCA